MVWTHSDRVCAFSLPRRLASLRFRPLLRRWVPWLRRENIVVVVAVEVLLPAARVARSREFAAVVLLDPVYDAVCRGVKKALAFVECVSCVSRLFAFAFVSL